MRRCRPGFTLIEMVVAGVVLAIGMLGVLAAFSTLTRAASTAEQIHTATLLGQKQLSEMQISANPPAVGDRNGDFGASYPGFHYEQNVEQAEYDSLYKITVTVRWNRDGVNRERVFGTYMRTPNQADSTGANAGGASTSAGSP